MGVPCVFHTVSIHLLSGYSSSFPAMSSSSRKHEETWRLLQPELMTREQLVTILKERNVQIDEESSESEKSHLIGIFRRIVLPLAQRTIFQRQPTLPDLGSIKLGDTSAKNQNHFNSMTTSKSWLKVRCQTSQSSSKP